MKSKLFFLLTLVALAACNDDLKITNQRVFFEMYYYNNAWGYSNNATIIDSTGNMSVYVIAEDSKWIQPDSTGKISRADMNRNLALPHSVLHNIKSDSLQYYVNLIDNAAEGELSEPAYVMADAGIIQYLAYVYDEKSDNYKRIMLYQWGDVQITNSAPESQMLSAWLTRMRQYQYGIAD